MSDLDLSAAIEAAASAWWAERADDGLGPWGTVDRITQRAVRDSLLGPVVAAAPLIAAQVRAQIAADIEALAVTWDQYADRMARDGLFEQASTYGRIADNYRNAAQTARGDA